MRVYQPCIPLRYLQIDPAASLHVHEFVEDLEGVEVIADDFLIAGFGSTDHEVNQSLERNERAFFEKCRLWNLKLNRAKVKRHQPSVKFMGHLLTSQGLMPDPEKIQAT